LSTKNPKNLAKIEMEIEMEMEMEIEMKKFETLIKIIFSFEFEN